MTKKQNEFAFAKNDIKISDSVYIEKNDVGIIKNQSDDYFDVFFIRVWDNIRLNKKDVEIFDVKNTGDAFDKKICNVCHKILDTNLFDKNQNGKNNRTVRRPSCQDCRKIIDGVNMSQKTKNEWNKIKPDLQEFECPICRKKTIAGVTSKIVLDHDHTNGKARAWICDSCNTGIGRFKDDVSIIKRAIDFLNQ